MKKQNFAIIIVICFTSICFLTAVPAKAQKDNQQFGYAETSADSYQSRERLFVMSPVIFGANKIARKTMNEDYLLEKVDVAKSIFKTYAGTFAYFISGNWCFTEINSISWSICEEK